jgi:transposase
MANRLEISDKEWNAIYPILAAHRHVRMASEAACRAFLVAVMWVLRSGVRIPWSFGHPFHGHSATDSMSIRPPVPRASGH